MQKRVFKITNKEYLLLVAMLLNPNHYRIDKHPEQNKERIERIKKLIDGTCQPLDWKDCELNGCK